MVELPRLRPKLRCRWFWNVKRNDRVGDFVTDACATVAIAYHRAAAVYVADADMQELGTAAVHLLTMATSYTNAQNDW